MKKTLGITIIVGLLLCFTGCASSLKTDQSNPIQMTPALEQTDTNEEIYSPQPVATTDDKRIEYLDNARSLATENKFNEALATIETAESLYGSTAECASLRTEIQIKQLLFNANEFENNGDYQKAIELIEKSNTSLKSNADVIQKFNVLKIYYINDTVSNVDSALKQSNYDKAVELINNALGVFPNDATLLAKLDECKDYKPVDLSDIRRIDDSWYIESGWTGHDFSGNPIVNGWICRVYLETKSAEFYTERKYSNLSFDISPISHFSTKEGNGSTVRVYADDVLVYTSPDITYKSGTVHASVDIIYADNIRITVTGRYNDENSYIALSNATVSK